VNREHALHSCFDRDAGVEVGTLCGDIVVRRVARLPPGSLEIVLSWAAEVLGPSAP
jgi:hypothetical protein